MKDSFNPILKSYNVAFTTLSVPAWALQAPVNPGDLYVVYSPISATGDESKTCSGQEVYVRVSIYNDNIISGKISKINDIANEVYNLIYANPGSKMNVIGMQNYGTELVSDNIVSLSLGQRVQTQRVIIFNHKIFFNQ